MKRFFIVVAIMLICSSAYACGHGGFVQQSFGVQSYYPQQVFVQSYPFVPLTFQSNQVAFQTAPVFINANPGFVNVNVNGRGRRHFNGAGVNVNAAGVNVQAAGAANVRFRSGLFGTSIRVR